MQSGIYQIRNLIDGKLYIGSTSDFQRRKKQHFNDLLNNCHCNIRLQRAINKYGIGNFVFEILEKANYDENIVKLENHYMQILNSKQHGYNIANASFGDTLTNHPNREKIKQKISKTLLEKNSKLTNEERKQKWGRCGNKNGMFGKTHSPEVKNKLSAMHKGNKYSAGRHMPIEQREMLSRLAKERTGSKNSFFGKKHTEETKRKIGASRVGKSPSNIKIVVIDGVEYAGLNDAAEKTGIKGSTIWHRIHSKNQKYINYFYKAKVIV